MKFNKIKYLDMISNIRNELDLNEFQQDTLDELEEIIEYGEPTLDHLEMIEQRIL
jgi:hypothetical protein